MAVGGIPTIYRSQSLNGAITVNAGQNGENINNFQVGDVRQDDGAGQRGRARSDVQMVFRHREHPEQRLDEQSMTTVLDRVADAYEQVIEGHILIYSSSTRYIDGTLAFYVNGQIAAAWLLGVAGVV